MGDWGWVGVEVDEAAVVEEGVAEGDVDDGAVVVAWSDDISIAWMDKVVVKLMLWL